MKTIEEQLAPCPFCGGAPIVNSERCNGKIAGYVCEIYCQNCRVSMENGRIIIPRKVGESEKQRDTRKKKELKERLATIVSRWNKRFESQNEGVE